HDVRSGLADGMINDFEACGFDPGSLQCGTAGNDAGGQCLAEEQVVALRDIFGGARNSRGESLYGPFTFDTGIANPAWRSMHLGSDGRPPANATLGADTLRLFAPSFGEVTAQPPLAVRAEPAVFADEHRARLGVVLELPLEPSERPARKRSAVRHVVGPAVPDVHVRVDRDDVARLQRLPVELGVRV